MTRSIMHYVIIGNSAAGLSAAKEVCRHDMKGDLKIISNESSFCYSRVMLPLFISGKISKRDMVIAPRSFYASQNINLLRGESVEAIDPGSQRVHLKSGKHVPYDKLLIATGSSPKTLDIPGIDLQGIHYLRKFTDAEAIKRDLSSSSNPVLLVGGGLVSVKALEAFISKKKKVHLVISSDRILSQMLDQTASDFFLKNFERNGVKVHFHTDVKAFMGKTYLEGALLSDGTTLSCNLAIIVKGVIPSIEPIMGTGIACDQGIIVDHHMATNLTSIYAAGDVAESYDILQKKNKGHAIWPIAVEGGRVAGSNMALTPSVFSGALRMNSVDLLGIRVISAGEWEGEEQITSSRREGTIYQKLVFAETRLKGFVLVGDIGGAGVLTSLIKNQTEVSISALEEGLERGFSYWPRLRIIRGSIQQLEERSAQA